MIVILYYNCLAAVIYQFYKLTEVMEQQNLQYNKKKYVNYIMQTFGLTAKVILF